MAQWKPAAKKNSGSGANLGFEQKLWQAADKLRGHMDAARMLSAIRDTLLPKLISGEIRVRGLERETEKAFS